MLAHAAILNSASYDYFAGAGLSWLSLWAFADIYTERHILIFIIFKLPIDAQLAPPTRFLSATPTFHHFHRRRPLSRGRPHSTAHFPLLGAALSWRRMPPYRSISPDTLRLAFTSDLMNLHFRADAFGMPGEITSGRANAWWICDADCDELYRAPIDAIMISLKFIFHSCIS